MQSYHSPPWQNTNKFAFVEKKWANSTMNLLSLILHCLVSGPVCNGLDLLCCWRESKELSYLLYTGSQVLKAIQWKGNMQYAYSNKGVTHLGCALLSSINNTFSFTVCFLHYTGAQLLYSPIQAVSIQFDFALSQTQVSEIFLLISANFK